jgi:hypothetical protein
VSDKKVFLSHASTDNRLSGAVYDALVAGGLDKKLIFYTGNDESGVEPGLDFPTKLRSRLQDASIMIQLLTPTYITRPMCLMEFGAAWISTSMVRIPIIVPPLTPDIVNANLGTIQCMRYQKDKLEQIFQVIGGEIQKRLGVTLLANWAAAHKAALESFDTVVPVAESPVVTRSQYESLELRLNSQSLQGLEYHRLQYEEDDRRIDSHELGGAETGEALSLLSGQRLSKVQIKYLVDSVAYNSRGMHRLAPLIYSSVAAAGQLATIIVGSQFRQPRYRAAWMLSLVDQQLKERAVAEAMKKTTDPLQSQLLKACLNNAVAAFIANGTLSTDLDDGIRERLLYQINNPKLRNEIDLE